MVPSSQSTTDHEFLRQAFRAQGLEFLGVAPVESQLSPELAAHKDEYRRWLSEGRQGSMTFLERHELGKYDPNFSLEGTRSVLIAGLGYFQPRAEAAGGRGLVARYAWGRDYHKVLLAKLRTVTDQLEAHWAQERWRCFTDTAPLDERFWAQAAGGSFTARNTLAIRRGLGSWFLLGEILTTKVLSPTSPEDHAHGSCPSGCRRCISVCPTGALDSAGRIDGRRCISYLTIEHRGPIDDSLKAAIGSWIFGCDLCQEVCPFNLGIEPTTEPEFLAWKAGPDLALDQILALDGPGFTARFGGSPVHRAGRNGLVRNACIVAANQGRTNLVPTLATLVHDSDLGVADAARWAHQVLTRGVAE